MRTLQHLLIMRFNENDKFNASIHFKHTTLSRILAFNPWKWFR